MNILFISMMGVVCMNISFILLGIFLLGMRASLYHSIFVHSYILAVARAFEYNSEGNSSYFLQMLQLPLLKWILLQL
jgi:hypothetical protein